MTAHPAAITSNLHSNSGGDANPETSRKLYLAAKVLAWLGALFLIYQLWGYVSWIVSPDFVARSVGPDPIQPSVLEKLRSMEKTLVTLALLWLLWLIYGMLKSRALTWPAITSFAWVSCYWQDPLVNLVRHNSFTYNAYFFNRGDWMSHLPFMPDMGKVLAQPLLIEGLAFFCVIPFWGMFMAFFLRNAQKYLAIHSGVLLIAIGWALMFVVDLLFEKGGIQNQVFGWNYVAESFALNAGTPQQWPFVEGILVSFMWALPGFLSCLRGQNRFSIFDPGIEAIRSTPLRVVTHLLAMAGLFNLLFLVYNAGLIIFAGSIAASFPSYLSP